MSTEELVRHMCDGKNSLNSIVDLLVECGRDRSDAVEAWIALSESGNYTRRTVRVPRDIDGENIGLDEIVLVPN